MERSLARVEIPAAALVRPPRLAHVERSDFSQSGQNGLQGLRMFNPCTNGACDIYENPNRIRLTSNRWYPSSVSFHAAFFHHGLVYPTAVGEN